MKVIPVPCGCMFYQREDLIIWLRCPRGKCKNLDWAIEKAKERGMGHQLVIRREMNRMQKQQVN